MSSYVIGVDFGTESGRAVVIDTADGRALGHIRHGDAAIDRRTHPTSAPAGRPEAGSMISIFGPCAFAPVYRLWCSA